MHEPSVTLIRQKNAGAAGRAEFMFDGCQRSFVQFLDADDLIAPDKIERQLSSTSGSATMRSVRGMGQVL